MEGDMDHDENEGEDLSEDSDDEDDTDPFEAHFSNPSRELLKGIEHLNGERKTWETKKTIVPGLGRCLSSAPGGGTGVLLKKMDSIKDLKLKQKLVEPFQSANGGLRPLQKALAPSVFKYQDILFSGRTADNADELRRTYCLHALNHVYKTRDRVLKNNARLNKGDEELEFRDQGFTRPKVLFILPTRNSCVKVVDSLVQLANPEQQENKKRFQDTFSIPTDQERISETKPEEFRELFSGNHDDLFRVGIKFTRKTFKYFAQFYNSDIILASPLGLRLAIGDESDKKRDYDFLSSIEMVIIDQADALLMQNWDHVEHVFKHLNLIPKESHGCDFGRVRNWYLDGHSRYLRQTIVLSQFLSPELNALFNKHMLNISGRLKNQPEYDGVLNDLGLRVRQIFTRFESPSPAADPDARFKYLTSALIPYILRNSSNGGILVFIPSYFDFIRLRNYLDTLNISFGLISEETPVPDVARARSHFLSGRHSLLLYTGRAHHFRRYELRGVKEVICYGLPENVAFYREIVGGFLLRSVGDGKVDKERCKARILFSKWDALKVERVVGTKRVGLMCNEKLAKGDTFEYV
ncbi:DUF1253-domain-containing protein [Ascodesmis nigricans]|uniref:U3 small nucleolar RNA-associated protein 25 n=1 Tax=Ascodesmis nigricans TaxID=341454 RepID=A0A4S2MV13_9PEZI|nr:DUF1253-domain-containing protein [Ascodesmis nigricans]